MTHVVHCKKESYDFYGGRPSFLGNPMRIGQEIGDGHRADRDFAIQWFKEYFLERVKTDKDFRDKVLALKDKTIACWCRPKEGFKGRLLCHLQIVAGYLDNCKPEDIE